MFSKVFVTIALVLGLTMHVQAHALIAPALGVSGTGVRKDVQQPTAAKPCGKVNIAQTLDTSTAVPLTGDTFTTSITNFNAGKDGSRQVTASVDAAATGQNFVAATVPQNGDLAPKTTGTQQLTVQLPAGTQCTGGASGDLCLVAFKTASNRFGNCIVVQQAAAGATANTTSTDTATTDATGNTTTTDTTANAATNGTTDATAAGTAGTTTKKAAKAAKAKGKRGLDVRAAGTRAARALKSAFEELL